MINMTRTELARHVGVSRRTLWKWQKNGLIPAPERVRHNLSQFCPVAIQAAETLAIATHGGIEK